MDINYKTSSNESANLIALLNAEGIRCFDVSTAQRLLKEKQSSTIRRFLNYMVDRGLLMRIKEGMFYIVPYDQDPRSFMPDWHYLASCLASGKLYYIGYYSAMQLHSLITQPALKEQIVVNQQFKPTEIKVKDIPFQFIYHNQKHFFGLEEKWINSYDKVFCSDLEKTFVDALFKPHYAGGITEIAKALHKERTNINFDKILRYILKFDSLAVGKRLGYLMQLLDIDHPIIESLQGLKTGAYFALEPKGMKTGKRLLKWNIQENVDHDDILSPIFT